MTLASLPLDEAAILHGMSSEEMTSLRERARLLSFDPGDHLMESGHDAPGVYIIRSGLVTVVVETAPEREREVANLGKGECVGEMAVLTQEPCSATARALTETEAWLIQVDDFVGLLERCPSLWRNLGRILSRRLVRTSRHLSAS